MKQRKLFNAFLLAAPIALGGCAAYQNVDSDTCNQKLETFFGIPELLEIFKGSHSAHPNENCHVGYKIAYSAFVARQPSGDLHPASIVMWQRQYQANMGKIAVTIPDEAGQYLEIKKFADYFVRDLSQQQITSEMLQAMFDKKQTNPKLFLPDGSDAPRAPEPKPNDNQNQVCVGKGMLRECIIE